ncbi:MAG: glutamate synthase [Deltaproteobacteria bacterium]|nr:glutamate synthase [Deltaproteobacteria bacterium]
MAELHPIPFATLVRRAFTELAGGDAIFDLPKKKLVTGSAAHDTSVRFHGHRASSPLGPAAGPQTQMAQNLVLSWLAGCRIFELKTVQILDELQIPRPCIDMQTIGYNVEWSQELKLAESLEEYVKGSMLIEMLRASGQIDLAPGFDDVVFDMSVGYDLKGIQSEPVQAFIRGMGDASALVERFRAEIPDDWAHLRDLPFRTKLSDTLTLSTFHGCPPDEIEKIIDFLLRENRLNCVVKLNPTLLGPAVVRGLLADMGYHEVHVPDSAFEKDASWAQVQGFVGRLGDTAARLGLGFGVKFTNTLVCENHRDFFPASEKEMYLSGPPLHVLAMKLVAKFREVFGDRFPISFSAGIDRKNFPDAVALGLTPITVCSDLLQPGGYGRAEGYFKDLCSRMDAVGAADLDGYVLRAYGKGDEALALGVRDAERRARCAKALEHDEDLAEAAGPELRSWVSAAKLLNTAHYTAALEKDARYGKAKNDKPPRKLGTELWLFECVTCDKCVPVCPNDANFLLMMPPQRIPVVKAAPNALGGFDVAAEGAMVLGQKHQIANFADFCNECGNCDVFCPEDGGPYVKKPRFFGTLGELEKYPRHDGYVVRGRPGAAEVTLRVGGKLATVVTDGAEIRFSGDGFAVTFSADDPEATVIGAAKAEVDLTHALIARAIADALLAQGATTWVGAAAV